jgi:hypothetical protein
VHSKRIFDNEQKLLQSLFMLPVDPVFCLFCITCIFFIDVILCFCVIYSGAFTNICGVLLLGSLVWIPFQKSEYMSITGRH